MRSVVIHPAGGHDRLKLVSSPDPSPGPGEVRVRTEAIGVNYADVIVRMGLYASAKEFVGWPITPGFEVAGVLPPKVTTFPLDEVAEAHRAIESGRSTGKLVLLP